MDVNVHPTKAIVKFLQEDEIIELIEQVVIYRCVIENYDNFRKC